MALTSLSQPDAASCDVSGYFRQKRQSHCLSLVMLVAACMTLRTPASSTFVSTRAILPSTRGHHVAYGKRSVMNVVTDTEAESITCDTLERVLDETLADKKSQSGKLSIAPAKQEMLLKSLDKIYECHIEAKANPEAVILYLAHVKHRITGKYEHFKDLGYDIDEMYEPVKLMTIDVV